MQDGKTLKLRKPEFCDG